MPESKYYTVNQVAEMFDMHPKTIRRYIQDNTLKACKVGGQWRVTEEELKRFMQTDESFQQEQCDHWQQEVLDYVDGKEGVKGGKTQVLSIIDHYADSVEEVKALSSTLIEVINSLEKPETPAKFRYEYEPEERKVRFILKGSPGYVLQMLLALQQKEG